MAWCPLMRTTPSKSSSLLTGLQPSAVRIMARSKRDHRAPDVLHAFNCSGALGAMLFVDPESNEGAWLQDALKQDIIVVPDVRLASAVSELRRFVEEPFASMEIGDLVRHC